MAGKTIDATAIATALGHPIVLGGSLSTDASLSLNLLGPSYVILPQTGTLLAVSGTLVPNEIVAALNSGVVTIDNADTNDVLFSTGTNTLPAFRSASTADISDWANATALIVRKNS